MGLFTDLFGAAAQPPPSLPDPWQGARDSKSVIVQVGQQLSEKEIDSELAALSQRQFDALILMINEYRLAYVRSAPTHADGNNALNMARDLGASEAYDNLLVILDQRRATSG